MTTSLAVSEFDSYGRFGATEKYDTAFFNIAEGRKNANTEHLSVDDVLKSIRDK